MTVDDKINLEVSPFEMTLVVTLKTFHLSDIYRESVAT